MLAPYPESRWYPSLRARRQGRAVDSITPYDSKQPARQSGIRITPDPTGLKSPVMSNRRQLPGDGLVTFSSPAEALAGDSDFRPHQSDGRLSLPPPAAFSPRGFPSSSILPSSPRGAT